MTMIDEKQEAILSSVWSELEADGPVTLERLNERLSGYIAWDGMPTDDAALVLSRALPRIEKAVVDVGKQVEKGLRPRDTLFNEWQEREDRQIRIAAEALAVITPRDADNMERALRDVVSLARRRDVSQLSRSFLWPFLAASKEP